MTRAERARLTRGDGILVPSGKGGIGTQYALVSHWSKGDFLYAFRWNATTRRWTTKARLVDLVHRRALLAEVKVNPIPTETWLSTQKFHPKKMNLPAIRRN